MEKEIKINVPDGYEIDKENSTFECIKFKPIEMKLPKTWEEYCKTHKRQHEESWVGENSDIESICGKGNEWYKDAVKDKNLLPSKELAEAMLALCQLIQLRDCYNDGWVPDWTKVYNKYVIYIMKDQIHNDVNVGTCRILAFKTKELSDKFLNNFKDLIEIAKPLL